MAAMAALLFLALAVSASAAPHVGCPACGPALTGRKIATVHPGEPAGMLFGVKTAKDCADQCRASSPDVLFYQHFKSTVQGDEPSCLCLATCYSVYEADPSEEAEIGSLCRDLPCPAKCSNAPASNVMYLGNPDVAVYQGFTLGLMNGTSANGTRLVPLNATLSSMNGTLASMNGTMLSNSTLGGHGNSTHGNSTVTAAFGMTYEECRAYAASNISPPTPYFTHLEAMSACLMYENCGGIAPAGTNTAKSGSFCLPSLLRGRKRSPKQEVA